MRYDFASDNTAAWCPEARAAFLEADDDGAVPSYGEDPWTAAAADSIRELFETACDVYFVFNGTAANSLALATLCEPYHSVVAHEVAHILTDECGAPEFFSNGSKLLAVAGEGAQIDPDAFRRLATGRNDIHFPKPRALSITQSTEFGTVYPVDAVRELGAVAHELGLRVHMDGARFANAVAALECAPADVTWRAGVDVLCFGGTKNGMGMAEAVVFFDPTLSEEFAYRCKQAGQLASKMRYLAAPWARMLADGSWLIHARHANAMAQELAGRLQGIGIGLAHPVHANEVFARLDHEQRRAMLHAGFVAYDFIGGATRFVCSWQTTPAVIDELIGAVAAAPS